MTSLYAWLSLVLLSTVSGTELVPERYLRPRDFNHHPFTDVGQQQAGQLKSAQSLPQAHPYALLASKKPREGRQFPDQDVVLYPDPPSEVLPRKVVQAHAQVPQLQLQHEPQLQLQHEPQLQLQHEPQSQHQHEPQAIGYDVDPYSHVPKNYAFSYAVRDQHSGDDFSHSQAHNGQATRGQYRVKLPDGRVQVVSYTADHKGYRADVQYEGEAAKHYVPQATPTPLYEHNTPAPEKYIQKQPSYTIAPAAYAPEQHHFVPTAAPYIHEQPSYTAKPVLYAQDPSYTPTPTPYVQHYSPTPTTFTPEPQYVQAYARPQSQHSHGAYAPSPQPTLASPYEGHFARPEHYDHQAYQQPTPTAYEAAPETYGHKGRTYNSGLYPTSTPGLQAYASPSPSPYEHQQYDSPSSADYEVEYGPSSPSPFSVQPYLRSTPSPFTKQKFVTSTEAPSAHGGHILVTPRTLFNAELSRRGFSPDKQHLVYKFSSPS